MRSEVPSAARNEMSSHPDRLTVGKALHLWFTHGNRNAWEMFTHAAIALGALVLFTCSALAMASPDMLHMPAWGERLASIISKRLVPQNFAYVMTVLASLIAAVCTGFCAMLFGLHRGEKAKRHGARLHAGDEQLYNLGHITALVVSLFSSVAATFGFAATYAIPQGNGGGVPALAAQYTLAMSFLQLSISTGVVGITLIPIVNNRKEVFVVPLVMAVSTIFWLPALWMFVLLLAMPGVFRAVLPMFSFIVGAPMAQALFPHGVAKRIGLDRYRDLLWSLAAWGFGGMAICAIVVGLFIMLVTTLPTIPAWYYIATIRFSFGVLGVALCVYSIYIEGIRKLKDSSTQRRSV